MLKDPALTVASFFSGAGGLDEGFKAAGFSTLWANEISNSAADTFELNHGLKVDRRSIVKVPSGELPKVDGIIGGPPCQSWSAAGARRGESDPRGALFFEYIRMIGEAKPKFFLAENVQGLLSPRNAMALEKILTMLGDLGYNVTVHLLNAADFGVPQTRKRVFIVGFRRDLEVEFSHPEPLKTRVDISSALVGVPFESAVPVFPGDKDHLDELPIPNHHYWAGEHFSYIYMSRNRRRDFKEQSFTIQASASHAPLHPLSAPMIQMGKDSYVFDTSLDRRPRRLSVRECARIQTFPDEYKFSYGTIKDGYKQVGNAVPVLLAKAIAQQIRSCLAPTSSATRE